MTRLVYTALLALTIPLTAVAQTKPETPADLDNPPATATRTADGLVWYTLKPATSDRKPQDGEFVKVRYAIFKEDGMVLDYTPTELASVMSLERMMPGWREIVSGMAVGQKTRLWLPSELSGGKMPEGALFVIDTELIDIIEGPKTPSDLENPPAEASTSKSGLVSMMIRAGTGTVSPTKRSKVIVNYSGWTTDGRLFDSTLLRGLPAEFRVGDVIAGWTEGLQLMKEGEVRRFWIPSKLAYAKDPSKPQGTLVFDIELVKIK
jgi:FKBP-type peptidyl-prolyl cis-trans isomerase